MKISLIICNKNEEQSLPLLIRNAKRFVHEIIVMDGHSTDQSVKLAKKNGARVYTDNGKGKGAAIREGIQRAKGDILILIDADGSPDYRDIPRLAAPIVSGSADLVLASRMTGGSDEFNGTLEKTIRVIGSAVVTQIINSRFKTHITDSQNGFRALRASVAKSLDLKENTFTIEGEILIKTLKKGARISEIPSHESVRKYGVSRICLRKIIFPYIMCIIKNILTR